MRSLFHKSNIPGAKTASTIALRQADGDTRSFRRKWDSLDISMLMESALDSFAVEFHGVAFDQLTDNQAKRIVGAIAAHCIELGRACVPIPYELTEAGKAFAGGKR